MNELIIPSGEQRDIVLWNEASAAWHIVQQEGSTLRLHLAFIDPQADAQWEVTHQLTVEQCGPRCSTSIYGVAVVKQQQHLQWTTNVQHHAVEGHSHQLLKMVLYDAAQASFHGLLRIDPNAQRVQANQTNRNIVLSSAARMTTEPQLEIYADDVQAAHGASTGQLDDNALFYMQQRCIDRPTATRLLLNAFLNDVILPIKDETIRQQLEKAIDSVIQ